MQFHSCCLLLLCILQIQTTTANDYQNIEISKLFSDCDCTCKKSCGKTTVEKVIPDCKKDIMFLIDTSACMEPSFPRINRAQIEIVEKISEKFGFGSDGTARVGLMLDSFCYPRSETCDTTVTVPFGFDAFDTSKKENIVDEIIESVKNSKDLYLGDGHVLDNALEDAFIYFMSKSKNSAKHLVFIGNGNSQPHNGWYERVEQQVTNLRQIGVQIWPITPMHCTVENEGAELCPDKRIQAILRQPGFNTSMYINGHDDIEAINAEFKDMLMDGMECDAVEVEGLSEGCEKCNCECPFTTPAEVVCKEETCNRPGPRGAEGVEGPQAYCKCSDKKSGPDGLVGETGKHGSDGKEGECVKPCEENKPSKPVTLTKQDLNLDLIKKIIGEEFGKINI